MESTYSSRMIVFSDGPFKLKNLKQRVSLASSASSTRRANPFSRKTSDCSSLCCWIYESNPRCMEYNFVKCIKKPPLFLNILKPNCFSSVLEGTIKNNKGG